MDTIDAILTAYLEAAEFTDCGDTDQPASGSRFADEAVAQARADCAAFWERCREVADGAELTPESVGHDLWLTRNHHGAGFWDRDLGGAGDILTDAAHAMGERSLYQGDDGLYYFA